MVNVEGTGIDDGGYGGGDDGIVMILVGGGIRGVDVEGIGLCHCRGNGRMVDIGEMSFIVGEGAGTMMGGVD